MSSAPERSKPPRANTPLSTQRWRTRASIPSALNTKLAPLSSMAFALASSWASSASMKATHWSGDVTSISASRDDDSISSGQERTATLPPLRWRGRRSRSKRRSRMSPDTNRLSAIPPTPRFAILTSSVRTWRLPLRSVATV